MPQSGGANEWRHAAVLFEEPDLDASATRGERQDVSQAASELGRARLLEQLEAAGLRDEAELDEATPFSVLLVRGTPRAIEAMKDAPGVQQILPVPAELNIEFQS